MDRIASQNTADRDLPPAPPPRPLSSHPPVSPPPRPSTPTERVASPPPGENDPSPYRRRRNSGLRRSVLGAPAQRPPSRLGESAPPPSMEPHEQVLDEPVVVDACDEEVGEMTSANAVANAEYLAASIESFRTIMASLHCNGTNEGYSAAYQAMNTVGRDQPALASQREANKLKNRYGNIMAYDHSRVVLPVIGEDPDSDYVNANFVDGYNKKHAYIASQGPVPNSFISFWRMIWHCKTEVIVMVTHEIEGGRMKCHRYWPDPTSSPPQKRQEYGEIAVTHVLSEQHKSYIMREFTVEYNGETRQLKQFACLTWPDHGVPLTTAELLGFRNAVKKAVCDPVVPIVIHCSAGVGRTGTYIAIDHLVEQCLDQGGPLDVDAVVRAMRMARNYMVQTEGQYMFIFRAVLDAISELLSGESKKAEMQTALADAARQAEENKRKADAIEQAMIEEARRELLARNESSAASAAAVINKSIKDRMNMLQQAQSSWMDHYRQTLEEWNARNQTEAETYDLTSTLTPVQSRLEALRQQGLLG
uniref:protein-tyrosine-phosphatase n=1 Tax=Monosiga ovata TaxID=81526 RepID=E5RKD6_9EUKA|nr:protein tyrosine phosphatase [Monosiga ovata]